MMKWVVGKGKGRIDYGKKKLTLTFLKYKNQIIGETMYQIDTFYVTK